MNFWIGIITGFILAVFINQIRQERTINYQKFIIEKLKDDKKNIKQENFGLRGETKRKDDDHETRISSLEDQMAKAFEWFGSMIRHSAEEPFKKEAIEKFLAEEELKNNTNG